MNDEELELARAEAMKADRCFSKGRLRDEVTNDADAVIAWLAANLEGGIGKRKVYYRDTDGRFDELKVNAGAFAGFAPCSEGQQTTLAGMLGQ